MNSTAVEFDDKNYSKETLNVEKVEEDFQNFQEKHSAFDMTKTSSVIIKLTKIDNVINELKNTTTVDINCTSLKEETKNDSIEYSEDALAVLPVLHYVKHLKVHVAERKQQKCEICGKSYTTLKAIGNHKVRMHGIKQLREKQDPNRLVQCEICGKSLKRKCLKNHKEVVHEKIKKNERKRSGICDQCGKFVNNLYCHKLYLHHTEDEPLTCKTCGKTVNNKHVLQKHEKACVKIPCKYINKILFRNKRLAFLKRFAETFHLIQTSYI